ncbi:Hypothetical predicted protein [Lecanosticta acicola]|uniref:Uncharacterized protein n=1 Tax=Lecanosticta acicola TaxID=111012 RepID=A0AAI8YXQ7_9PEZI|nr:Hypothetical predicted protein [Lecanosticta acicola]
MQPEGDFKRSIDIATSHSFAWMTELTLQDASLTADDLLHIPNLRNLKNIQIIVSKTENAVFHDRIIRSWAEAVMKDGCFSKLESIFKVTKASAQAEKAGWILDRQSRRVKFSSERPRRRLMEGNQANTPLLKLTLKGSRKALPPLALPNQFEDDRDDIFCFERDWQFQATNQGPQPEEEQRAKKRKVRDGKALPLNSILDGL